MDKLILKWGTLKGWELSDNEEGQKLLKEYSKLGMAYGAMQQNDTEEQKEIICKLIEVCNGDIWNDWDDVIMPKKQAKEYVLSYGLQQEDE